MRHLFLPTKTEKFQSDCTFSFDTEMLATQLDPVVSKITEREERKKSMVHFSFAVLHALTFYIRQNQEKDNFNDLYKNLYSYPSIAGDHMT